MTADLSMAEELGRPAGIAVDNARLYQDSQRALRAREDLLAIVSHDLRSPLGIVTMSAAMLLNDRSSDRQSRDRAAARILGRRETWSG